MADPADDGEAPQTFFNQPPRMPGSDTFTQLKGQWDNFFEQPGAKTALLQFGLNMMQRPSFGDSPMSQLGRAIGAAGEAVTRQQVLDQKEAESEARQSLAEQRAETSRIRAEGQQERTANALTLADLRRQALEQTRLRDQDRYELGWATRYNDYLARLGRTNAAKLSNPLLKPSEKVQEEPMSFEEYKARSMAPEKSRPPVSTPGVTTLGPDTKVGGGGPERVVGRPPVTEPSGKVGLTGRPIPPGAIVTVHTQGEIDALPEGTHFRTPQTPPGKVHIR